MFDGLILSTIMPYVAIRDIVSISIALRVSVEDGGYNPLRHDAIDAIRHHISLSRIHAAAAVAISSSSVAVISLATTNPSIFFLVEGNASFNLSDADRFWAFIVDHYRSQYLDESPEMYHYLIANNLWISTTHDHVYATYGVDDYERYYAADHSSVEKNDWHNLISPRHGLLRYSPQKMQHIASHLSKKAVSEMYDRHPYPDFLELVSLVDGINLSQSTSDSSHP